MTESAEAEIEAAACVIEDLLHRLVPLDQREAVLAKAMQYVREEAAEVVKHGRVRLISAEELADDTSPAWRHHDAIKRLKAHAVLVFTRDITNNSSPSEAAQLLFGPKPGPGSGLLSEYLKGLPGVRIDAAKAMKG